MARVIDAFTQFFDDSGDPLVNGWLKFTVAGTNNTDKDTFSDLAETVANANPVQLDAAGRCPDIFGSGTYRVVSFIADGINGAPGTQIQQFDPVGQLTSTGAFEPWLDAAIYSIGRIVVGSDGLYYVSLTNSNQGNNPTLDAVNWTKVELTKFWNTNATYSVNEIVRTVSGDFFISRVNNNIGIDPDPNSTEWRSLLIRTWGLVKEFDQYEICKASDGTLWKSVVALNANNDPLDDDGTNWASVSRERFIVVPYVGGGGTLTANAVNELQDSLTYTLPLANSVFANESLFVELPDKYADETPTVQRGGADTITHFDGTDTSVIFDAGISMRVRFTSNGISDWRI